MNWETYIAFGDSITNGARTYLGYPELVGNTLSNRLNKQWNVINHSISGFRAIDLARYIDKHFNTLKAHKASISSILIGTNDIKEKTTNDDFKIALNQIVIKTKLLTTNMNVLIFAIPEFHKGIMYPYSIDLNNSIFQYNILIKEIATKQNIRMLELTHTENDFWDGVHLNNMGITNFSNQISSYILKDRGMDLE